MIKDAEMLAAEAFGAKHAFFIVNGTTAAVQTMIFMQAVKAGDKIIMPRNVHRSVINALVVCGAIPVYVNPGTNKQLEYLLECPLRTLKKKLSRKILMQKGCFGEQPDLLRNLL